LQTWLGIAYAILAADWTIKKSTFKMALIGISIGLALLMSLLAWRAASAQTADVKQSAWDAAELETVVDTLATLTDPAESIYLRESMGHTDFVRCRRERALSARKCLRHIGNSASFVLQLEVPHGLDAETRQAARDLIKAAARVRLVASVASMYLFLVWLFPGWMCSCPLGLTRFREFQKQAHCYLADA
jgi:uncharacterized membrane protein YdbT with pleckstrin-like domain